MDSDWVNGELGDSTEWNAAGVKVAESTFAEDGVHSLTELWYDSGRRKLRMEMARDEPDGDSEAWYESGARRARGRYDAGRRIGEWECWEEHGSGVLRLRYADDGTILDWSGTEPTIVEWTRQCLRGCPGERIDELNELEPDRRCDGPDSASGPAWP